MPNGPIVLKSIQARPIGFTQWHKTNRRGILVAVAQVGYSIVIVNIYVHLVFLEILNQWKLKCVAQELLLLQVTKK
jgi:hypothetical protein